MKKAPIICMLLLAIVLLFAACGGNDNPLSNNEGNNNEAPVHTHSFSEWDTTVNPTCTEDGTKVRYCSCGEKQSETVVMLGHTPADAVIEDKVDATYEANGSYNEVVRCVTCGEKLSEVLHTIPMLKHVPAEAVTENVMAATCYGEGSYDTVVYCSDCDAELERTRHIIDKIAHTPDNAVEENFVDSTCYSDGSKDIVVYCSVTECHAELERNIETISKKAHIPAIAVEENRVEATFEKDGSYQIVIYCSVAECYEELERTTYTLDMLVHHPGSVVIENEIAATCSKTGSYDEVIYCLDDNCGHKELSRKTITVDVIPHINGAAIEENRVDATCYSEGRYENVVYCSVCNTELFRNTVTLAKISHVPADAVVENLVNATCTTDGKYDEVVYCGVAECNAQISRATKIIDALGHTEVIDAAVEATCTTTGLTEGKHCYVCNEVLIKQEIIFGKHSFANQICSTCGEHEYFIFTLLKDNTYSIKARSTDSMPKMLTIPSEFNGITVTEISIGAFAECNTIEQILIPETIKKIYEKAFCDCENLFNIIFNATECRNGYSKNIFLGAGSATDGISVTIGSNVKRIPEYLFAVETELGWWKDTNNIISVEFLEGSVCEEIGFAAFHLSKKLTTIILPDSVTFIDIAAFEMCTSLESIYIPVGVTGIPHEVFNRSDSLTDIYYQGSREQWAEFSVGAWNDPFLSAKVHYCASTPDEYFIFDLLDDGTYSIKANDPDLLPDNVILPSVYDGKPVTKIEDFGFSSCNNIKTITIPSSITSIGGYAFYYCANLSEVLLTDGLLEIDYNAFFGCAQLASIFIPETVIIIGSGAFSGCTSLNSIRIPNSITSISTNMFSGCTQLTDIEIGSSVTTIENSAFYYTVLNNVYYRGTREQWDNISICGDNDAILNAAIHFKEEYVPTPDEYFNFTLLEDGTYSIGVKLEYQYSMPSLVVIPSSYNGVPVTAIDEFAFMPDRNGYNGNKTIISIIIPESVKKIGMAAFSNCESLTSIKLPSSITYISASAFQVCTNLKDVYIPISVLGIHDVVFNHCNNLENIYYEGSETLWESIKIGNWNDPIYNATIHYNAIIP